MNSARQFLAPVSWFDDVRNGLPTALLLNRTFADRAEQSRLIVP
jgi:hypothetical protein